MFETRDRESNNEFQFHELVDRLMCINMLLYIIRTCRAVGVPLQLQHVYFRYNFYLKKKIMLRNNALILVLEIYIFCGDFFSGVMGYSV